MFIFLYLKAFEGTGGIEKFCRAMIKALESRVIERHDNVKILSAYDKSPDKDYFKISGFKGFGQNKIRFFLWSIHLALKADTLLLAHINLSVIGVIIKYLNPRCKIKIVTHGIEVWGKLSSIQKLCLQKADEILAVSNFTREILIRKHFINPDKISIFRNTLDPNFNTTYNPVELTELRLKLQIPENSKILLTIARLQNHEQLKGYDKVVQILKELSASQFDVYYILGGKYTMEEYERIWKIARNFNVEDRLRTPGYIDDKYLTNYYALADLFVMPSKKEGFGIVFIESMACGTPVIAGDKDGSCETILNDQLGSIVDPDNLLMIKESIISWLRKGKTTVKLNTKLVFDNYGFHTFKHNVNQL
jgi:phosphatidylinositol alpha-1,6-mannosyltransferase